MTMLATYPDLLHSKLRHLWIWLLFSHPVLFSHSERQNHLALPQRPAEPLLSDFNSHLYALHSSFSPCTASNSASGSLIWNLKCGSVGSVHGFIRSTSNEYTNSMAIACTSPAPQWHDRAGRSFRTPADIILSSTSGPPSLPYPASLCDGKVLSSREHLCTSLYGVFTLLGKKILSQFDLVSGVRRTWL